MYIVAPIVLLLPASITALSSACKHIHLSRSMPYLTLSLHLLQPPSLQFGKPNGVPLYPVDTTLFPKVMMAPFPFFMQLDLEAASSASFIKYVSKVGLTNSLSLKLNVSSSLWNYAFVENLL